MNDSERKYLIDNQDARESLAGYMVSSVPHVKTLGIDLVSIERNRAKGKLRYHENLVGNIENGALHNGALISLIDTIAGLAVLCALPEYEMIATLDLRLDSFKPSVSGKDVYATAECYKLTRTIAFVSGSIFQDSPDDPLASCVATFFRTGRKTTTFDIGIDDNERA